MLCYLLAALTYGLFIPMFEGPDEREHFGFVVHLAENATIPDLRTEPGDYNQQGSQGPLYYLTAAALIAPLDLSDRSALPLGNPQAVTFDFDDLGNKNGFVHTPAEDFPFQPPIIRALHIARAVSALFGALAVFATLQLAGRFGPTATLLTAVLMAALPQFVFLGGMVTNDTAAAATAMLTLWLLQRYRERPNLTRAAWVGLSIGAAILSKAGGAALLPLAAIVVLLQRWPGWRRLDWTTLQWRPMFTEGPLILALALAVSGWWLGLNFIRYGDPTGVAGHLLVMPGAQVDLTQPANLFRMLRETSYSYWGVFGLSNLAAPDPVYLALLVLSALTLTALPAVFRTTTAEQRGLLWLALGWALLLTPSALAWMVNYRAWHGRLLFPALGVFALFTALSLRQWTQRTPAARLFYALPILQGVFTLAALPLLILPAYAHPPTVADIPASASPICRTYEDVELLAIAAPTQVAPGDVVTVTAYWRMRRAITYDEMLLWQLATISPFAVIGQENSYHGQGTFPTKLWQPGVIYADTVYIRVAEDAPTTTLAHLLLTIDHYGTTRVPLCQGAIIPPGTPLAEIRIAPRRPAPPQPAQFVIGDTLALLDATWPDTARPGETVTVTLTWQVVGPPPAADLTRFLHLDAPTGFITGSDGLPGGLPARLWQPGDRLTDTVTLTVPADAAPGDYTLAVGMYRPDTGERLAVAAPDNRRTIGTLTIAP